MLIKEEQSIIKEQEEEMRRTEEMKKLVEERLTQKVYESTQQKTQGTKWVNEWK